MTLHPDFLELLGAFADARVEYLLVGGYAVAFHATPRFTKDLDLWIRPTPQNLARVRTALVRFGAPANVVSQLESASDTDVLWMGVVPTRIDLVKGIPGPSFDEAWQGRVSTQWAGVSVTLIGREALLAAKRACGRPQDLLDVAALESGRR